MGKFLAAMAGMSLALMLGVFLEGFMIAVTWNWFLYGVIPGIPAISYLQAVGISLFLSVITFRPQQDHDGEYSFVDVTVNTLELFAQTFIYYIVVFVVAGIFYLAM